MKIRTGRREFLTGSLAAAAAALAAPNRALAVGEMKRNAGVRLRLALNAYSFNRPLMAGTMNADASRA